MARMEKMDFDDRELSQIKQAHPFPSCAVFFFGFILVLLLMLGWVVASTGLVAIPVLSSLAFKQPTPNHLVVPGVKAEVVATEYLSSTLVMRIRQGQGELKDRSINLALPESSLTASLKSLLDEAPLDFLDPSNAQVTVIADEGFELFIPLNGYQSKSALKVYLKGIVQNDVMTVSLKDLWIGSFHIPNKIVTFAFQPFIDEQTSTINKAIGSTMKLTAIEYQKGTVILLGSFIEPLTKPSE